MKNKHFPENGWKDYLFQKQNDRETLKKINLLIADICENGTTGIGKPEPLTGRMEGCWSRRINDKDRLVYCMDDDNIYILSCRFHDD